MRRVIWSPRGLALYERDVLDHLARQGPGALQRVRGDIERAVEGLGMRATGRPGRVAGTYEKSVTGQPYIIAYGFQRFVGDERPAPPCRGSDGVEPLQGLGRDPDVEDGFGGHRGRLVYDRCLHNPARPARCHLLPPRRIGYPHEP